MRKHNIGLMLAVFSTVMLALSAGPAVAQPYRVLHSFGSAGDGRHPGGSLTLSLDGATLYGMTWLGGATNRGTIFKMTVTPPANTAYALTLETAEVFGAHVTDELARRNPRPVFCCRPGNRAPLCAKADETSLGTSVADVRKCLRSCFVLVHK